MSAQKAMNMRKSVESLQHRLSCAAKQSLERRFGALYDKFYREDVLWEAWRRVRANKGAPGVDEQDFAFIESEIGVERFLAELGRELHDYTYRPCPVLRCWIDKPGKAEKRPLGIPIIRDRVAQMCVKLVLEPIFEANFMKNSHGYRPGLSQHTALTMLRRALTFEGKTMVIDADIRGCFNNIRHDILIRLVQKRVSDPRVIKLIRAWLKAGVMEDGQYQEPGDTGTPQGGVLSPLLTNIYLHCFDMMLAQSGIYGTLVRYADDLVVVLRGDVRRALRQIRAMLRRLGLELHPEKTRIVSARKGFDFLGARLRLSRVRKAGSRLRYSCRLWPSDKSMQRIREGIRTLIGRRFSLSLEEIVEELNPLIRGWNNYHQYRTGISPEQKRFRSLNWFVRERIRIFLKRKYSDRSRGGWRVPSGLTMRLGLAQFGCWL
jgi:group II intron reverse transcriptase/maturase